MEAGTQTTNDQSQEKSHLDPTPDEKGGAAAQKAGEDTAKPAAGEPADKGAKADAKVDADAKPGSDAGAEKVAGADEGKSQAKPADGSDTIALKASEGSLLDENEVKEIETLAKTEGLNSKQAQKLLEREEFRKKTFLEDNKPGKGKEWIKRRDEFEAEVRADKNLGGTPEKLAENVSYAEQALKEFFPESVKKFLFDSALGSHKDFLRGMAAIGRRFAPDKSVHGRATGRQVEKSAGDMMYGEDTVEKIGGARE